MRLPETRDFYVGTYPKEQALKVLEESAEFVEAVKSGTLNEALEEMCDILQAIGNFCAVLKINFEELSEAYEGVVAKNTRRGRYE